MINPFTKRTFAIIKRELKSQILTKAFIITTILVPVLIVGLIGLQAFIMTFDEGKQVNIEIVAENTALVSLLQKEIDSKSELIDDNTNIKVSSQGAAQFKQYINEQKGKMLNDQLNGIFFIPNADKQEKQVEYYSANPKNSNLTSKAKNLINKILIEHYFFGKALSSKDIDYAQDGVALTTFKITENNDAEKDSLGAYIVAGLFAFLLYMSLLLIGTNLLRNVVEEKENRVVEVLLSSVSAKELMTAKIIGTACAGLLQITIWMIPFVLVSTTTLLMLPEELNISITIGQIAYFVLNYGVGLVTFLGLYAAVGAIFDNMSEAQQGALPIMIIIIIPFYICFSLANDPTNIIAQYASMVPFASIIVMPVRMAIVEIPVMELIIAMIVNIATLAFVFSFVGKIYRIGILKTGKNPSLKELYRWVKSS